MYITIAGAPIPGGWTPEFHASQTIRANRRNIASQSETLVWHAHTDRHVGVKQQNKETIYLDHTINL
jgi:hypothetical protein